MSGERVCFWKDDISFCLDLEQVSVPEQECLTQGQLVMMEAAKTEGLKVIACDQHRRCSLFRADAKALEEGLFASLGSSHWNNTEDIGVGTSFDYNDLYLITPDGRNYNCRNSWLLEYMGKGAGLLKDREDALAELRSQIMSDAEETLKEGLPKGKKSIKQTYTDIDSLRKISPNPFEIAVNTGFDVFNMTSLDEVASSDDAIALAFLRWVDNVDDGGIDRCLKGTRLFITPDSLGSVVFGKFYGYSGIYYHSRREIFLGPFMIDHILTGDEYLRSVVAHECAHHDFNVSGVRDEMRSLTYDAAMSVRAELAERNIKDVAATEATEAPIILAGEANTNEIIAYAIGSNSTEIHRTLARLRYVEANYPPKTSLYLFERLHETVAADGYMELGLKLSLLDKIEGFIANVRNQLG